jgi:5-methylcytosine-specific restriction protein A
MLAAQQELIREEVEAGTGAAVDLEVMSGGPQTGLRLWFSDLGRARSPIVELVPKGLKRYEASLRFGTTAGETVAQMQRAADEELQLARALIRSVADEAEVQLPGQNLDSWVIPDGNFRLTAQLRGVENRFGDEAVTATCRSLVIPILAAMAELYGYDPVEEPDAAVESLMEGAVKVSLVRRRERNPRNRLLCLRIHGSVCGICGTDPGAVYGDAGNIIEVHHIQPLSLSDEARPYDPEKNLIPVCPSCHRAAHTKRPVPWSPQELRQKLHVHD